MRLRRLPPTAVLLLLASACQGAPALAGPQQTLTGHVVRYETAGERTALVLRVGEADRAAKTHGQELVHCWFEPDWCREFGATLFPLAPVGHEVETAGWLRWRAGAIEMVDTRSLDPYVTPVR